MSPSVLDSSDAVKALGQSVFLGHGFVGGAGGLRVWHSVP